MKMRIATRLTALLLVFCLALSMVPMTLAADPVADAIQNANDINNFDYAYGTWETVDAGADGAVVTKTYARPSGAKAGDLYAAIVPLQANGSLMAGQDVRYVRLADDGVLTYFRTGCRYFAVQLVQPLPDAGDGAMGVDMTIQDDQYLLTGKATLTMSQDMAVIAENFWNKDEMADIQFSCHLRYSNAQVKLDTSTVSLASDIFDVVSVNQSADGYGYDVICRLQADWADVDRGQTIAQKLQVPMTMTATATISKSAVSTSGTNKLYATGWVSVTNVPAKALDGATAFQVPMETAVAHMQDSGVDDTLDTGSHRSYMNGYPNGEFRPDRNITRAEVAQMFYNLLLDQNVPTTQTFADVKAGKWYYKAICAMTTLGIIKGYPSGDFRPDEPITRAEFATMCARFANAAPGGMSFTDVPASHWAAKYIATVAAYGWVNGYKDGTFRPDQNIERCEAATMVNRMLERVPDQAALQRGEGRSWPDVIEGEHWAWAQIGEATTTHDYTKADGVETWK